MVDEIVIDNLMVENLHGVREFAGEPTIEITAASLEWMLLAATAVETGESDLSRVRFLLGQAQAGRPVHWPSLLALAEAHGTEALLQRSLGKFAEIIPAEVLDGLRERCRRNVQKSLFLARELFRILDCAGALGIELMPYKGIVLSETLYGEMALRQAGDLDLFVRKRDAIRMKNAVRDLGYVPRVNIPQSAEQDYMRSGYEYSFDGPAGKHLLELQWALQPRFYAVDYDMERLFERAAEIRFAGRSVKSLSPEDLLLVLSIHAAKHVWERIVWICDIAQVLKRTNLDWNFVLATARATGVMRILRITALLANRFFETPIPEPLERGIRGDGAAHALAEEIEGSIVRRICWQDQKMSYFRLLMRLRERYIDRMRFAARLAFTPGPGEWETVKLPRGISPLYRAVRLARLTARFSRRAA